MHGEKINKTKESKNMSLTKWKILCAYALVNTLETCISEAGSVILPPADKKTWISGPTPRLSGLLKFPGLQRWWGQPL